MEAIKCKSLSFTYPKSEYPALSNVSFSIDDGEFVMLIGKSAAGKSTLLKLLKKEIAPFGDISGELEINGKVGYVSQNIEENIVCDKVKSELGFGLLNAGLSNSEIELAVAETASYFNLNSKLDSDISSLSGGEKQLLNLASVMALRPDILVLDEPISQLDPISASRFINMVKQLHCDFGTTIIISEHNAEELFNYADSVIMLDNANLVAKLKPIQMISMIKELDTEMLGIVPVQMRLFDNATTIKQCRQKLQNKLLKAILDNDVDVVKVGKVKNVYFAYEKWNDVLDNLSLDVYRGKINAVIGANASGKSTLLKVLAGVKKNYRGKIKFDGSVAMLCQNPFDLFTKEKCEDEAEFGDLTAFLGIDDIKNQHPYDISGGQAGRLALAKVLQTNADVILLDEPTKALDSKLKIRFAEILKDLCNQGKTIVIVSHDIEFVGEYADYVSLLSSGKIISTQKRQKFFSSLGLYTTAVSKITNGIVQNVVSIPDLKNAGGI